MCMNKVRSICVSLVLVILAGCSKGQKPGNETVPKLSFEDMSIAEGNSGANNAELTLTLDHSYSKQVTINYTTVEGSAKAGQDFVAAANQTISFHPNEIQKKIVIGVVADDLKEGDEVFYVRIDNPVNVTLLKGTAVI